MRTMIMGLSVLMLLPPLAQAEDVLRWTDARGTVHYSNDARSAPAHATRVEKAITIEVERLPGAPEPALVADRDRVVEAAAAAPRTRRAATGRFVPLPDAPRIYDAGRLRFGCYTAGVLYYGGFAHADDISPVLNCYPYQLGPEAWLNAARAELGVRANGIRMSDMAALYREQMAQE